MKVFIKGKKSGLTLSKNQYLASGGQADIYVNGKTAYKIYNNKSFMIPEAKITELAALSFINIVKPEEIIIDEKNNNLGYTMQYVKDTYAMCQLFPKAFRDRNSLSNQLILDLIRRLQETVHHCHKHDVLIVDLNELNFLVAKDFKEVYAIDCDSYKTPHFPATAIMDSIRDRQVKNNHFTENSDWFSFGILSFQLFAGIHPFKGNHSKYKSLDERMDHNISVLNKDVSVPKVCLDFNTIIPEVYKNWYRAVFEDGKRVAPPTDLQVTAIVNTIVQKISGSNSFDIQELEDYVNAIVDLIWSPVRAVLNSDGLYLNKVLTKNIPTNANVIVLPKTNAVIAAWVENRRLKIVNATQRTQIPLEFEVQECFSYDNRLYVKAQTRVLEIQFNEIGASILATSKVVAQVLEYSSIFDGCIIQNMLGVTYISIFPNSKAHYQFHLKELDKLKILNAKFYKNVLMVICIDNGKYDKYIFRFDDALTGLYDLRIFNDIQYNEINFTVLDSGATVHILGDEKLEIFSNKKDSKTIKEVVDPAITGDIKIFKDGIGLLFSRNGKVFSMKMK